MKFWAVQHIFQWRSWRLWSCESIWCSVRGSSSIGSSQPTNTYNTSNLPLVLWLCQNSYWTWPFIVSFPNKKKRWFSIIMIFYQRVTWLKKTHPLVAMISIGWRNPQNSAPCAKLLAHRFSHDLQCGWGMPLSTAKNGWETTKPIGRCNGKRMGVSITSEIFCHVSWFVVWDDDIPNICKK